MVDFKIRSNEITSNSDGTGTQKNVHFRALFCPKVEQELRKAKVKKVMLRKFYFFSKE
jgi:hypothetical protein